MTSPSGPDPIPSAVGRYEILRELGRGAMGVVYEARDPALSRTVALKTILPAPLDQKEGFEERFFSEARIAARLSHPGIVVVHDIGRDPASGTLYIALEHLKGRTLAELSEDAPIDWREVCRLGAQVARALHHAHLQGVVHRDMKPANVMLLPSGEAKILDFGIARIETARFRHTNPGEFVGTPLYAAPEQATTGDTDARTDVFSLGSIAYTLLTGRPAFAADKIPDIVHRVVNLDPPPPSRLVSGIPVYVDRVIARAMAKHISHRYPDAQTLAEDLEAVLAGRPPANAGEAARVAAAATWSQPATDPGGGVELMVVPEDTLDSELTALVNGTSPPVTTPPPGAGTNPPAPVAAPEVTTLPPVAVAGAPAPGRRRRLAATAGALLLVGFAAGYVVLRIRDLSPEAGPLPPGPPPTAAPAATAPAPAESASPAVTPGPSSHSSADAKISPRAPLAGPDPGRLRIDFDHPLKAGTLRVWVDGQLVIEQKLSGTLKKKGLVFKMAQGNFKDQLDVSPGVRKIRFEVKWEDNVKTDEITGAFKAGETRTVEVNLGRLRKGLDLEWK